MNRRQFIAGAAAAAVAPRLAALSGAAGRIRLGAPVFVKTRDPEELALAHRNLGYRAADCPSVSVDESTRIEEYRQAFARHDVTIAEVGRWCNLMDSDPAKRRQNIDTVTNGLALAEAIGARCCVDIAGSFSTTSWFGPHPDNLSPRFFDAAVENARKIIDAVKPQRTKFCYEMMGWSIPDGVEGQLRLLAAVDRPAFGVHLDPCNLINSAERFYRNTALLDDCFDRLGRWIVSCHAKDLTWDVEMNIHFREVVPGRGSLDYGTFLRRLASLSHDAPLILEHLQGAAEYDQAREHIFRVGRSAGLEF